MRAVTFMGGLMKRCRGGRLAIANFGATDRGSETRRRRRAFAGVLAPLYPNPSLAADPRHRTLLDRIRAWP